MPGSFSRLYKPPDVFLSFKWGLKLSARAIIETRTFLTMIHPALFRKHDHVQRVGTCNLLFPDDRIAEHNMMDAIERNWRLQRNVEISLER